MRLVRDAEPSHGRRLDLRCIRVRGPLHLPHDRATEREVRIHRPRVRYLGREAVINLLERSGRDIHADRVDESQTRVEASVGLTLVIFEAPQSCGSGALAVDHRLPCLQRIREVIGGRDAVREEVEAAMQCRPVHLLGRHMGRRAEHRVAPSVQRVGDAEPAEPAREQVRMARHESGRDERTVDVERFVGRRAGRGIAWSDAGNHAVGHEHPPAIDVSRARAARGDRDEACGREQERHADDAIEGMFRVRHGDATRGCYHWEA